MIYHFRVNGRPVGKERPRKGHGKRFFTPNKTKAYEALIRTVFIGLYDKADDTENQWALFVRVYADGKVADGDNIIKSVADALNGFIWHDDRQIKDWRVRAFKTTEKPYIIIKAWQLEEK